MLKTRSLLVLLGITILFAATAQAAMVVQFLGQTDPATQQTDLEEALELAQVDLEDDTRLEPEQIAYFLGEPGNVPGFAGCFRAPMVDPENHVELGVGIDCLAVVETEGGVGLRALSFFVFNGGTLVTFGATSVQGFLPGVGDGNGAFTNMTGSLPDPSDPAGGIVGGTKRFRNASGSARVSGAVNLGIGAGFPNEMFFDCLWLLDVGPHGSSNRQTQRGGQFRN